jgi:hypothetical protein
MILKGNTLRLDGDAQGGAIRASIQHFDGSVPAGFAKEDSSALTGEFLEGEVHFQGGPLRRFGSQPVRLVIHLTRGARVYALGVA